MNYLIHLCSTASLLYRSGLVKRQERAGQNVLPCGHTLGFKSFIMLCSCLLLVSFTPQFASTFLHLKVLFHLFLSLSNLLAVSVLQFMHATSLVALLIPGCFAQELLVCRYQTLLSVSIHSLSLLLLFTFAPAVFSTSLVELKSFLFLFAF